MIFSVLKKVFSILWTINYYLLRPRTLLYLFLDILKRCTKAVYAFLSLTLISGIVLGGSIFLYLTFYMTYVPSLHHTWPIHLRFQSCQTNPGLCSEPYAIVVLQNEKSSGYMFGHKQEYQIFIDLEMPDSPVNQNLGMFSVGLLVFSKETCNLSADDCMNSTPRAISERHAMMEYKSIIQKTITSVILYPLYIIGLKNDHQTVTVEMFSALENDNSDSFYKAKIFLNTRHIEVYKANLHLVAKFSGLRYWMYYHPIISTIVGIVIFMMFLSLIPVLSLLPLGSLSESKILKSGSHVEGTKDKLCRSDFGKIENIPQDDDVALDQYKKPKEVDEFPSKNIKYESRNIGTFKLKRHKESEASSFAECKEYYLPEKYSDDSCSDELKSDVISQASEESNDWDKCTSDIDDKTSIGIPASESK